MSNSKAYEIAFRLGAKVQSSMGAAFNAANRNMNNMNNKLKESKRQSSIASASMDKLGGTIKAAAGAAAAYVGFKAIKNFASESVELAKKQVEAETKLQAVLQNVKSIQAQGPNAYKKTAKELINVAGGLEKVGVLGEEVTVAGMQQMATFQLSAKALKTLSPGMDDLLAQQKGLNATQQDAVGIGNMIGKVMSGQVSALSRVGINFTKAQEHSLKFGNEMERAKTLADVLKNNVGGVNKALAQTDQGKIQQMNNTWAGMRMELGRKILPIQAKLAGWFSTKIPRISSAIQGLVNKVSSGFKFIGTAINKVKPYFNVLTKTLGTLRPEFTWLKNIGTQAFNTILGSIQGNIPTISGFQSIVTAATGALRNGFESAKPYIAWIAQTGLPNLISFIGVVVTKAKQLGSFITNNWSKIKPILIGIAIALGSVKVAMTAMSIIQTVTAAIKGFRVATMAARLSMLGLNGAMLANPMTWIIAGIVAVIAAGVLLYKNWDKISAAIVGFWQDRVVPFFSGIGAWFGGIWQSVVDGFKSAWNGIGSFISGIFDGIVSMFKGYVNNYIKIANFLISGINKISFKTPKWMGGKTFGVHIPMIPMLANGGITTGPTLAMIGEGSEQEAVLPLSKLKSLLDGTSSSRNTKENDNQQIVFHLKNEVNIQGNADKSTISQALSMSNQEFKRLMENYLRDRRRLAF